MNVLDFMKSWSVYEIKEYYSRNSINAAVAMTHMEQDFNLSNVIRTANFFGFREVFYVGGSKSWDRRGAVGVQNYIPITFCREIEEFFVLMSSRGYTTVALENNIVHNPTDVFNFTWPFNPVIVVGEERNGIPIDVLSRCNHFVEIPAFGTVRSMNVATAAGIAMSLCSNNIRRYECSTKQDKIG